LKSQANQQVIAWLDRQAPETLFLTATSLSELLVGIESLPPGKRQQGLSSALKRLIGRLFEARILPFDEPAAVAYAAIAVRARLRGTPLSIPDTQIAAIAQVHGVTVATRDTHPFSTAGIPLINPWEE
jgi:toxin FitB